MSTNTIEPEPVNWREVMETRSCPIPYCQALPGQMCHGSYEDGYLNRPPHAERYPDEEAE